MLKLLPMACYGQYGNHTPYQLHYQDNERQTKMQTEK